MTFLRKKKKKCRKISFVDDLINVVSDYFIRNGVIFDINLFNTIYQCYLSWKHFFFFDLERLSKCRLRVFAYKVTTGELYISQLQRVVFALRISQVGMRIEDRCEKLNSLKKITNTLFHYKRIETNLLISHSRTFIYNIIYTHTRTYYTYSADTTHKDKKVGFSVNAMPSRAFP